MKDTLFIVNPISGNGRKRKIVALLEERGCSIAFTEYAGHAEKIAREATQSVVVAVGGDGTVNEVARGLMGTDKILGILPCGSGDGLALCLGISRDPRKALDVIENGAVQDLDCAEIAGHPFFSVSGVGFDAYISQRFASAGSRGLWTYVRECVAAWFSYKPQDYDLIVDGRPMRVKALLVTVSNSDQWGNGVRINPGASTCDGWLDVAVVRKFRLFELPVLAWRMFRGSIHKSRCVEAFKCRRVDIIRAQAGPAHYDGDCFECGEKLSVFLSGEKLRVKVPLAF